MDDNVLVLKADDEEVPVQGEDGYTYGWLYMDGHGRVCLRLHKGGQAKFSVQEGRPLIVVPKGGA